MTAMNKWIDLRDNTDKAKLKVATQHSDDGRTRRFLFILGLTPKSGRWPLAIERLGFVASAKGKYLTRMLREGEKIRPEQFHSVWPNATVAEMPRDDVVLNLTPSRRAQAAEESSKRQTQEEQTVAMEAGTVVRLGRNAEGLEVFQSPMGRFIRQEDGRRIDESDVVAPELFLRAPDVRSMDRCGDGFVRAMLMGEVQHKADLDNFLLGVLSKDGPYSQQEYDRIHTVVDAAMVRFLNASYETAQDAYGDANRLYDYLPQYAGAERGKGAMPLPVAVIAQRLLGDTKDKRVLVPNAWDGASFAFLARGTNIAAFRGSKDLSRHASSVREEDTTWADRFDPAREQGADGLFFNADPVRDGDGQRTDYTQALQALRALNPDARAVLVLAGDDAHNPGEVSIESRRFLDLLARRYDIEAALAVGAELTRQVGTDTPLRILALRNRPAREHSFRPSDQLPVVHSWDELKSAVDEIIVTISLREAEAQSIDVDRVAQENEFQRPYIAFSKVGEAVTMVPKNLQGPLQYALSSLEKQYGAVDRFVEQELAFGENTLGDRFSPEQVDALGLALGRQKAGRGIIIGDETGIGKGRILSGMATWANKNGKAVIFVTDRANLFSDLVRDLRDIEEWGRFRPLVMNADGVLVDVFTNEVLHTGTSGAAMRDILDNDRTLEDLRVNLVFLTYSQISGEDSPKADWILRRAENALVIVDEAHVAAGSDSNTSQVLVDLTQRAWGVVYSSATWAKTSENLHIYQRAMPETINMASLAATMRVGGEAFSELFSSMLARDGAFIRREHDLSKIEFVVETDTGRSQRNAELSDKVAEILSAMTYVGGEINKIITRLNTNTAAELKAARMARDAALPNMPRRRSRAAQAAAAAALQTEAAAEGAQGAAAGAPGQQDAQAAAAAPIALAAPPATGTLFRGHFGAGSVLYQVMRRYLAVLNTDQVTDLALKAVEENRKPVIVFEDTGETFLRRIIKDLTIPGVEGEADTLPTEVPPPTVRDLMFGVLKRLGAITTRVATEADFETSRQREARAEQAADEEVDVDAVLTAQDAEAQNSVVLSIADLPGVTPEQQQAYREGVGRIVEMIEALPPIPLNAVDLLHARLSAAGLRVGEISGRSMRLEAPETDRNEPIESQAWSQFRWKVVPRARKKSDVNNTVFGFNAGTLDALLINRSAATGLSLHASPRFADTRRRELIESQIPENPTDRIQLYGRVNRYDQIVTPKITIPTTGIYGEVRQLMMQNKKLARLSANIRSSRENAAEIKFVPDLLNSVGEEVAKRFLQDNGGIRSRLGIEPQELDEKRWTGTALIQKLTSRVALLRVTEQKAVYEELYEMFEDAINRHELAGENPLKAREMDLKAKMVDSRLAIGVEMDGIGSAFDGPVYLKKLKWKEELRPMPWRSVQEAIARSRKELLEAGVAQPQPYEHPPIEQIDPAHRPGAKRVVDRSNYQMDFLDDPEDEFVAAASQVLEGEEEEQTDVTWAGAPGVAVLQSTVLPATATSRGGQDAFGDAHQEPLPVVDDGQPESPQEEEGVADDTDEPPGISLAATAERLARLLEAKRVTELAGTQFATVEEALAAPEDNGVKRTTVRISWIRERLPILVPGARIGLLRTGQDGRQGDWIRDWGVVVGLKVPAKGKLAMLARWKVEYMMPGDSKPRSTTVAALMDGAREIEFTRDGQQVKELVVDNLLQPDIFVYERTYWRQSAKYVRTDLSKLSLDFDRSPAGTRTRTGYILDGNMYLASEWAQATKAGKGVIYTDDRGLRHRAVLLPTGRYDRGSDLMSRMPVRLWSTSMVAGFLTRVLDDLNAVPEEERLRGGARHLLFTTTYKGAVGGSYAAAEEPKLLVLPEKGIAMSVRKADAVRMSRALRSYQKRMLSRDPAWRAASAEERVVMEAGLVKIRTQTERGVKMSQIVLECGREGIHQAVDLLVHATGIELYLDRASHFGAVADEIQRDYFAERRRRAQGAQEIPTQRSQMVRPASDTPAQPAAPAGTQEAGATGGDDPEEEGRPAERLAA